MASGLVEPAGAVQVKYRRADGAFVETTLNRLAVEDVVRGRPVREFRWYKGRCHYSGWYFSSTIDGLVAYESRLELARILLADHDRAVVGIAAQPLQLVGWDRSRLRRHVPDLLLVDADGGITVVDVKPLSTVAVPENAELFVWTQLVCGWRGWNFEIWSGTNRCLLDNVRFLAGYRRTAAIATELIPTVLDAARHQASSRAIELALSAQHSPLLVRPVVLHLLWLGLLRADLRRPLSADTVLRFGGS
jgi:hypothetical protein